MSKKKKSKVKRNKNDEINYTDSELRKKLVDEKTKLRFINELLLLRTNNMKYDMEYDQVEKVYNNYLKRKYSVSYKTRIIKFLKK